MNKFDPLANLRERIQKGQSGCLKTGGINVFFAEGNLLHASAEDDVLWLLRRMKISGYLSKEEASRLLVLPKLHRHLLPSVPQGVYDRFQLERAQNNLFRWSLSQTELSFETSISKDQWLLSVSSDELLAIVQKQRQDLKKWYQDLDHLWMCSDAQKKGTVATLFVRPLSLRAVLLQSPLEEVHTLEALELLMLEGKLYKEPLSAQLNATVTGHSNAVEDTHLSIATSLKRMLRVPSQGYASWSSKDSFRGFIDELNSWFLSYNEAANEDQLVHQWIAEWSWPANVFQCGRWDTELLWRANCLSKSVFEEVLSRWTTSQSTEEQRGDVQEWINKWD